MNQNNDKSEGILVLLLMGLALIVFGIWYIRAEIAGFQKLLLFIDFWILEQIPFLQHLYPSNIMAYKNLVYSDRFAEVGYNVLKDTYFNKYNGSEYVTMDKLYKNFYLMNTILLSFLFIPFCLYMKKIYSVKIDKTVIKRKKEEVYPKLVDNKRRPSKNKIFEVMDYFPPVISNSEDEYVSGSIRLSKKAMDTAWMEAQKNKLEEMKKTLDEYDYLKLTHLEKFYIRNVNDVELLDYIRILVFKGKKPERNNKKPPLKLPKDLTKENREEVIKILKSNIIEHDPEIEYGRLLMPSYYIFTPLENKKMTEFECAGAKELISVLNKYVVEDFKGEIKKTIDELKKENIKLEKDGKTEDLEQNKNLIIEMENMLDPEFNSSRNKKILELATTHQYEETFLMGMLIYGRNLINLPIGVLAKMKFQNSTLWYGLTSIGRTYQYVAGLPLAVLYQIERDEADAKETKKLDLETINPEDIIGEETKETINKTLGDQFEDGEAFKN